MNINRQASRESEGEREGRKDKQMDGQMDGWKGKQTDSHEHTFTTDLYTAPPAYYDF